MEYEVFVTGIGGQGIQLIAKMLAVAATTESRYVMLNGVYGGEMRGGSSLATVVLGDGPLRALPVTAAASAAVAMHDKFWQAPASRLRPNARIVADSEIAHQLTVEPGQTLIEVPATRIAREIGNPVVAGMVLMAAFNSAFGLVRQESLETAMRELVPPYRAQHIAANEQALRAGAAALSPLGGTVFGSQERIAT